MNKKQRRSSEVRVRVSEHEREIIKRSTSLIAGRDNKNVSDFIRFAGSIPHLIESIVTDSAVILEGIDMAEKTNNIQFLKNAINLYERNIERIEEQFGFMFSRFMLMVDSYYRTKNKIDETKEFIKKDNKSQV